MERVRQRDQPCLCRDPEVAGETNVVAKWHWISWDSRVKSGVRKRYSGTGNQMNQIPRTIVLQLLRGYKWAVSPVFLPSCRYVPTCSEYAMEAVDRNGAVRGSLMALWRVLRCHPLAKGGLDPVVKMKTFKPNSSMPVQRET